jgi:hypothetical protein
MIRPHAGDFASHKDAANSQQGHGIPHKIFSSLVALMQMTRRSIYNRTYSKRRERLY